MMNILSNYPSDVLLHCLHRVSDTNSRDMMTAGIPPTSTINLRPFRANSPPTTSKPARSLLSRMLGAPAFAFEARHVSVLWEIVAAACLVWYVAVWLVSAIGYTQL